jgi:uncharacterized phage protein (TIGR01671 family)
MLTDRIIKFRGKRLDTREWIYGSLLQSRNGYTYAICYIENVNAPFNETVVDPHTIGQFTGCYDSVGEEIYEGDVIKSKYGIRHVVAFSRGKFIGKNLNAYHEECPLTNAMIKGHDRQVIGNIHDNPLLAK